MNETTTQTAADQPDTQTQAAASQPDTSQKSARRIELEGLDNDYMHAYAEKHGIDMSSAKNRDDAITLIELYDEEAAKIVAAVEVTKPAVRAGASTRKAKKADGHALTGEQIEAVQQVWGKFARNIPQSAQSSGLFELEKDKRKAAQNHFVPDGDYRVIGADWILTFDHGRFVEAQRGGPTTMADSYASVPATEHRVAG